MQFKQKKWPYENVIDFLDDKLSYEMSAHSVTTGGTISYDALPLTWKTRQVNTEWWVKYLASAIALAGLFFAADLSRVSVADGMKMFTYCVLGSFLFYACSRSKNKPVLLTIVPLAQPLHILHDDQYKTITDELLKRRRERLRVRYATVDMLNTPAQEFWKFRQLRDEAVISETEYSDALRQLYGLNEKAAAPVPSKLN